MRILIRCSNDLKALFDPVVEDVIKLVENQVREARIEENAMIGVSQIEITCNDSSNVVAYRISWWFW